MNNARIKQLEEFLEKDPNDPFLSYALAMEYLPEDPDKSRELFEFLLEQHPDYIATYYHAAALYEQLGERQLAMATYEAGVQKAKALGEGHALKELQSAYLNFQLED